MGLGRGGAGAAGAAVVENDFGPMLIGADPTNRIGLWQRMFAMQYNANVAVGMGGSAISAVDTALWDITGKALNQPVYQLLGGRVRDKVAVYATGLYYTEGSFRRGCWTRRAGMWRRVSRGMKTKVGGLPMDDDVKRVSALREAIGPDINLMVDANQATTPRARFV